MFETMHYIVVKIDGDYAHLKNANDVNSNLKLVARALLPYDIVEGSKVKYEMLEYEME